MSVSWRTVRDIALCMGVGFLACVGMLTVAGVFLKRADIRAQKRRTARPVDPVRVQELRRQLECKRRERAASDLYAVRQLDAFRRDVMRQHPSSGGDE